MRELHEKARRFIYRQARAIDVARYQYQMGKL